MDATAAAAKILASAADKGIVTARAIEIVREVSDPRSTVDHRGTEAALANTIGFCVFAQTNPADIIAAMQLAAK
jgi:hypothetical protein